MFIKNLIDDPKLMVTPSFSEGGGDPAGGGGGDPQDPPKDPKEGIKEFSQEQINEMVGKARKEGRTSAMKKFGVETDEEYEAIVEDYQNRIDGEKSELEKANGKIEEAEREKNEALAEANKAKATLLLGDMKVLKDNRQDVIDLLTARGQEINEENVKKLLEKFPSWIEKQDPAVRKFGDLGGQDPTKKNKPIRRSF